MIKLSKILNGVAISQTVGVIERDIHAICFDSRKVITKDLFVAIRGINTDGHLFIDKAIAYGATTVVCEVLPDSINDHVTYLQVEDAANALGIMASNFYGKPSNRLRLVGVTGTNGKTTVATLLHKLFMELGFNVGLLSTVQNQINDKIIAATHTTPDPIALNKLMAEMADNGCDYCFMEVSSHAVVQQRIKGLTFVGGVFTNLTHDHLDFHKTFNAYLKAKKAFFDGLSKSAFALTNIDDRNGLVMLQNTVAYKKTYGLKNIADYRGKVIENHFNGMLMNIDGKEVWTKLIGGFNAYNLLAAYSVAVLLEQDSMRVLTVLSRLSGAEGRFDAQVAPNGVVGIVDYAHTPDAVKNVLQTISGLRKGKEHIITVLGCGGDRDKTKRPEMASVAAQLSDKVIITSDNPRGEDPHAIINDMEKGVPKDRKRNVFAITDRYEAIKAAIHLAQPRDIVLIAGKGHEKYQEIMGQRKPFDDKAILNDLFKELNE
ncbi:UDP-N-acetylmuramoyl-L-alanyl-D-glutamate--2,6-diaminopimelate ligase [Olivibacter sp. SDN3]|uniref:UDP-N-acetylmuramoyl-L-alanyl-D-glutamate--2, 6-diaminopimelate ligase n=1 Tax=Olivibacter sp. SDN3 TaxID=2764720 RepID=UPI0016510322|nr:UDP-N-acetylmuramoyl-L-alanyl-D-glutamate--2,6-diaminopimelate ligase [Olivibacter sp. SDN3]QNL50122.1 UDP-N-acetylmuramoyl-L-alanyl-D-glutamate--2,6-diaminopimelate ligase [Olivibacter sp. SDN3]